MQRFDIGSTAQRYTQPQGETLRQLLLADVAVIAIINMLHSYGVWCYSLTLAAQPRNTHNLKERFEESIFEPTLLWLLHFTCDIVTRFDATVWHRQCMKTLFNYYFYVKIFEINSWFIWKLEDFSMMMVQCFRKKWRRNIESGRVWVMRMTSLLTFHCSSKLLLCSCVCSSKWCWRRTEYLLRPTSEWKKSMPTKICWLLLQTVECSCGCLKVSIQALIDNRFVNNLFSFLVLGDRQIIQSHARNPFYSNRIFLVKATLSLPVCTTSWELAECYFLRCNYSTQEACSIK